MVTFVNVSPRGLNRLPSGSVLKNPPANAGDARGAVFNPWVRKIPWRRRWQPLQYSCLENPMDRGAWQAVQSIGLQRVRHNCMIEHTPRRSQLLLDSLRSTAGSGWSPGFKEGCLHLLPTQPSKMINQKATQVLIRSSSPHNYLKDQDKNNSTTHFTSEDTAAWKRQVTHSCSPPGLGPCPRDDLHPEGVFYNGSLEKIGAMLVLDDIAVCSLVPQE